MDFSLDIEVIQGPENFDWRFGLDFAFDIEVIQPEDLDWGLGIDFLLMFKAKDALQQPARPVRKKKKYIYI